MREKTLGDLVKRWGMAKKNGEEIFTFQDKEILTAYAKYMIEYYVEILKMDERQPITLVPK